jgi:acyl-CoA reductase-like NAD-dependent aldehyde dehydrogenase
MYQDTQLFIAGTWRPARSGRSIPVLNPATGKGDRVGVKSLADGKKVRFFKSSGEQLDV